MSPRYSYSGSSIPVALRRVRRTTDAACQVDSARATASRTPSPDAGTDRARLRGAIAWTLLRRVAPGTTVPFSTGCFARGIGARDGAATGAQSFAYGSMPYPRPCSPMGADSQVGQRTTRSLRRWRRFEGRDLGLALVGLGSKRISLVVRMDSSCGSPPVQWLRMASGEDFAGGGRHDGRSIGQMRAGGSGHCAGVAGMALRTGGSG